MRDLYDRDGRLTYNGIVGPTGVVHDYRETRHPNGGGEFASPCGKGAGPLVELRWLDDRVVRPCLRCWPTR